jgi:hypothetical protein
MPTIIYDRDNPKGRPANAGDSSAGVYVYAHDESTGKVEVTFDGAPVVPAAEVVAEVAPPPKAKAKKKCSCGACG